MIMILQLNITVQAKSSSLEQVLSSSMSLITKPIAYSDLCIFLEENGFVSTSGSRTSFQKKISKYYWIKIKVDPNELLVLTDPDSVAYQERPITHILRRKVIYYGEFVYRFLHLFLNEIIEIITIHYQEDCCVRFKMKKPSVYIGINDSTFCSSKKIFYLTDASTEKLIVMEKHK